MSVQYKFKSFKNSDAVKFDGVYISVSDLKSIIAKQNKMNHSELQIENEQTHHIYKDDESIPKNTNVLVIRMPFANPNKRPRLAASHSNHNGSGNYHNNHHSNNNNNNHQNSNSQSAGSSSSSDPYHSSSNSGREALELVSTKNMSEEEKIKYIQTQSTKDFDPARYARGGRGGYRGARGGHRHFVPHPGYTCRKCGIPGHSIYDCKVGARGMPKRSSGIPRDFLMKVDSKEKGALMTPSGEYAVPFIDREAYNNPKVEKAPFFEDGTPSDDAATSTSKAPTTLAIQ